MMRHPGCDEYRASTCWRQSIDPVTTPTREMTGSKEPHGRSATRSRLERLRVGLLIVVMICSVFAAGAPDLAAASLPGDAQIGAVTNVDPAATSGTSIDADEAARPEISGSFSKQRYEGVTGDPVEIEYTADNTEGPTYLLIGGNRLTDTGKSVGFVDIINVTGSSSGSVTLNTRLLGTDEGPADSCNNTGCDIEFRDEEGNLVAEGLEGLPGSTGAGGLPRPLVAQRYRLAVTGDTFVVRDSGVIDPVESGAESDLVLRDPEFHDQIETFVTDNPADRSDGDGAESLSALRENGADQAVVAKGDRIVLGFESTGIWGALSHFAENRSAGTLQAGEEVDHRVLGDLLEAEEGVTLSVRQTNPGQNERRSELDLSAANSDDVTVLLADAGNVTTGENDPTASRFYLVLDTSDDSAFTADPEPGDEFAVEFALEGTEGEAYRFADTREPPGAFEPVSALDDRRKEQFPYLRKSDGRVTAETSFRVGGHGLQYDHITDDGEILVETGDARITGETVILPQTEMSATFTSDDDGPPGRTESELTISNMSFAIDVELANATPGDRLNYRLYEDSSLRDSRTVIVVEDATNPERLRIVKATTNLTVTQGERLSNLSTTVRNVGALETRGQLSLTIGDGLVTERRQISVDRDASQNETFSGLTADLEPGEYAYTLAIDGGTVDGTLTVKQDPAVAGVNESDEGDDSANMTDGKNETDDAGDVSGGDSRQTEDSEATDDEGATDGNRTENDRDGGSNGRDDTAATLFLFGIGTRETVGGTVLVGVIYLLGHWV